MHIVVYARVSTEEQARTGFSLAQQLQACRERAAALASGAVVAEFTDDSSGELLERPGLQAALELVRRERAAWFVCLDPDRLARRLMHQLLVTDEIERTGCRLEFVQHDYQETAEGRLFYQMRGAIAEFEKAKILERTARGQRGKISAGGLPHVIRMYGYRFIKGAGKLAKARDVLVPDDREAVVVRQIFAWAADGAAPAEVARRLNGLGVSTKTGRGLWRSTQVARVLQHPAYATGRLALGKRDYRGIGVVRRLSRSQRRLRGLTLTPRPRPPAQWQEVEIEPLVDEGLWSAAQQPAGRPRRQGFRLLSGLGRCGLCGAPLHYVNGRSVACSRRCGLPAKTNAAVENAVWMAVAERLLDPLVIQLVLAKPSLGGDAAWLGAELTARQAELARLGQLFARGLWPEAKALPAMEAVRRQIELLEQRAAPVAPQPPDLERLRAFAAGLPVEKKASLLRLALSHYELHPSGRRAPPAIRLQFRSGTTCQETARSRSGTSPQV